MTEMSGIYGGVRGWMDNVSGSRMPIGFGGGISSEM